MTQENFETIVHTADGFSKILRKKLSNGHANHPETLIASAARMSGTLLFRSFSHNLDEHEPGVKIPSEQADINTPKLVNLMLNSLKQLGHMIDKEALASADVTTALARLSLLETQELLDPWYMALCEKSNLTLYQGALSAATTVGLLIHECRDSLIVDAGCAIAIYGFNEAARTTPRRLAASLRSDTRMEATIDDTSRDKEDDNKKPWYQIW